LVIRSNSFKASLQGIHCIALLLLLFVIGLQLLALAEKSNGTPATYCVSKAALNMYCLSFSVEQKIKDAGCKMLIIHPVIIFC
jgi:hypothetical protein